MLGLLSHMHATIEAIREVLATLDTTRLESWRPTDAATASSPETFLAALVADEIVRRGEGKPRLELVVDNENLKAGRR